MIAKLPKYIFIVFTAILLIIIVCITFFNYNSNSYYELREYFNKNAISIQAKNNLDINKVDIFWISDFKSGQIIKNGKNTDLIFKEYGPNKFIVLYQKDTIKEFTYFKTNNWHAHKHIIALSKENNKSIKAEINIIGPDIN